MAQYFDVTVLYTPSITYNKDIVKKKIGAFEEDLVDKRFEFENNHIPYLKESRLNRVLKFDARGVKLAKEYAYLSTVSAFNGHYEYHLANLYIDNSINDIQKGLL